MLRWHLSDLLQLTSHYSITHHITALHRPLVTSLFTVCTLSSNCHITRMPGMHFPQTACPVSTDLCSLIQESVKTKTPAPPPGQQPSEDGICESSQLCK